jgi:hypothetical protein
MKNIKNIFKTIIALTILTSCSSDDSSPDEQLSAGADHTYSVSITDGILSGTNLSGTLPNDEYMGMYYDYDGTSVLSLTLGTVMTDVMIGGAIVMINNQMNSVLNDEYNPDSNGSTLMITFAKNGVPYTFVSISGSCTVSNLNTYSVTGGIGGASYKLNFSGSFRQENFEGDEQDAPIVQISGNVEIKKLVTD